MSPKARVNLKLSYIAESHRRLKAKRKANFSRKERKVVGGEKGLDLIFHP